jgi:hypothetical protein
VDSCLALIAETPGLGIKLKGSDLSGRERYVLCGSVRVARVSRYPRCSHAIDCFLDFLDPAVDSEGKDIVRGVVH